MTVKQQTQTGRKLIQQAFTFTSSPQAAIVQDDVPQEPSTHATGKDQPQPSKMETSTNTDSDSTPPQSEDDTAGDLATDAAKLQDLSDRQQARHTFYELVSIMMILIKQFSQLSPPVPEPQANSEFGFTPRPSHLYDDSSNKPKPPSSTQAEAGETKTVDEPLAITRQMPVVHKHKVEKTSTSVKLIHSKKDVFRSIGLSANKHTGHQIIKGLPVEDSDSNSQEGGE